ncbi:DUF2938 family protein [Pantoea sp. 1.19]|uniref:DUF2938 family protein n=1 Tax=Pantoea sp. 1.19 TaxID=1925589 RepID=UPI000948AC48|nr:DUF2938 family protein [Pantoea sp. 1.19]
MEMGWQGIALGVGATLIMDLWALFQARVLKIPSLDYRLVGRWIGRMRYGEWRHRTILQAPVVAGEKPLGWLAHYLIGVLFATLFLSCVGPSWLQAPALLPALLAGIISVLSPFLIMQPAFGFGVAAARTPHPSVARRRSLIAHLSFGVGLWLSGCALRLAGGL